MKVAVKLCEIIFTREWGEALENIFQGEFSYC